MMRGESDFCIFSIHPIKLYQHHATLDSTSDLTHPGGGAEVCMGHISVMRWAFEVGEGGFLSQFLMGSVVVFDFKTPFARLGGQNP